MNLKNIFGVPRRGIHSYRVFDIAIVDVLATIIVAYGLSYIVKMKFIYVLLMLFILGIIVHRIFHVNTTINRLIFKTRCLNN